MEAKEIFTLRVYIIFACYNSNASYKMGLPFGVVVQKGDTGTPYMMLYSVRTLDTVP